LFFSLISYILPKSFDNQKLDRLDHHMSSILPVINEIELAQKRVLIRVDFNVPFKNGVIKDDTRIVAALPTIQYALDQKAKVILVSHFGRPVPGQKKEEDSLLPIAEHLAKLLGLDVTLTDEPIGESASYLANHLKNGQVMMLENIRLDAGETANDDELSKQLALLADVYINDAFGAAHRAHASTAGVAKYMKDGAALGFLMGKEASALSKAFHADKDGYIAVLGGSKVSDKIEVLKSLVTRAQIVLIGGAMAYTFLAAQGHQIGKSRIEKDHLATALEILALAKQNNTEILLPVDHLCAEVFDESQSAIFVDDIDIPDHLMGLDIGPTTTAIYCDRILNAKNLIWNGPMGVFEWKAFAQGTNALAQAFADAKGYTLVGGGDSVSAIHASGLADQIDHISTGGGASLEFLEGKLLPGIESIKENPAVLKNQQTKEDR
jgi:phosphoglycerate kinase